MSKVSVDQDGEFQFEKWDLTPMFILIVIVEPLGAGVILYEGGWAAAGSAIVMLLTLPQVIGSWWFWNLRTKVWGTHPYDMRHGTRTVTERREREREAKAMAKRPFEGPMLEEVDDVALRALMIRQAVQATRDPFGGP